MIATIGNSTTLTIEEENVMLKRMLSLALAALVLNLTVGTAQAKSAAEREAKHAANVKQSIFKLGTGENALIKLQLRDNTKLEGYVSQAGDESFVVTNARTGVATTVAYPQVVKAKGHNLSTGAKIAIGVSIAVLLAVILFLVSDRGFSF